MSRLDDIEFFDRLYRIFKNTIDMLIDRGSDKSYLTKHYINKNKTLEQFMKNYENTSIVIIDNDRSDIKHIVYIDADNMTTNKKDIQKILQSINRIINETVIDGEVNVILVLNKVLSSDRISESELRKQKIHADRYKSENRKIISILDQMVDTSISSVEVFFFDDCIINPNKHVFIGEGAYRKLSEKEKDDLLKSGMYKPHQIPPIDVNEPLIRWHGGQDGDIFKIMSYNDGINGGLYSIQYRLVKQDLL